jgi:hypothetical protein
MIYYIQLERRIILITIYSKSEQSDVTINRIRQIIQEFAERQ